MDKLDKLKNIWRQGRPALRRAGVWAAMLAAAFLAGRSVWMGLFQPAGLALVAAGAVWGWPILPVAAAALVGAASLGWSWTLLPQALALAALCLALTLLRKNDQDRSLPWCGGALLVARAFLLIRPRVLLYDLIVFGVETVMAAALFLAFWGALSVVKKGGMAARGGAICVSLALATLCCALPGQATFVTFSPVMLAVSVAILGAGVTCGASVASAVGLAAGAVLWLSGRVDPYTLAALGLCGLAAGSFTSLGRFGVIGGYALAALLTGFYAGQAAGAVVPVWSLILSSLIVAAIPRSRWQDIALALTATRSEMTQTEVLRRAQDMATDRMMRLSACFDELSQVFLEIAAGREGTRWEDVSPLLDAVVQEVCKDCPRFQACWKRDFYQTYHTMLSALAAPGARQTLQLEDFPQTFQDGCLQMNRVLTSLRSVYGVYRLRSGFAKSLEDSRTLVGRQLKGVSRVLRHLGDDLHLENLARQDGQRAVRETLRAAGISAHNVTVREGPDGLEVSLRVKACGGRRKCATAYPELLERALGRPMRKCEGTCSADRELCRLTFRQAAVMLVDSFVAQTSAVEEACGDAVRCQPLSDREYMLALSDGMGTGARAALESNATLQLLERFHEAGFSEDVIFQTINQVLLLRSTGEMYATVDLCLLDLVEGEAKFIKIGAAPSYILRRGQAIAIQTPSLPLGILDEVQPASLKRVLQEGDMLVMVSDGLCGQEDWLEELLPTLADCTPKQLCGEVLLSAAERGLEVDDRTVMAARIACPEPGSLEAVKRRRLQRWKARVAVDMDASTGA